MRRLLEGRAKLQHPVRRFTRSVSIGDSRAPPTVSVPVLSNKTVCVRAKSFERAAALHQDSAARGLRDAGDEGDRRREDERTRRGRDENRKTADKIAGHEPRGGGDHDGRRKQDRAKRSAAARTAPSRLARRDQPQIPA